MNGYTFWKNQILHVLQEPFIRMTCYYIYINKTQSKPTTYSSSATGSLASTSLLATLSRDLVYINKVIEESINAYKMEIFWDNLTLSMSSIHNILLNEASDKHQPYV